MIDGINLTESEFDAARRFVLALRQIPATGTLEVRRDTQGKIHIFQVRRQLLDDKRIVAPRDVC